jgi:imidazolonepropionase-like amidohydrolase
VTLVLRAAHLFDGISAPIEAGVVVIDGDRIIAAGKAAEVVVPDGAHVVDLGERALIPGLIDAHIHLQGWRPGNSDWPDTPLDAIRAAADARRVLDTGFTTVRDCGSAVAIGLRTAIAERSAIGPRILAAGPPICQTGGHADPQLVPYDLLGRFSDHAIVADGTDECRRAVRRVIRAGGDLIKITTTGGVGSERDHMLDEHFTVAEIEAIVDEAHRAGRRVAAHAQGSRGVLNAIRAGVDTIEHGYFIDEECVDAMLEHGTGLVPTFGLIRFFRASLDNPRDLPAWRVEKQRQCIEAMERSFPLAAAAGVPIATGSDDYGIAGRELGRSAEELIAMVEDGGVDALRVLRFSTSSGATLLGLEGEAGVLRPGAAADVIAVDGRPWERIAAIRDVAFVMRGGSVIRAPA